MSTLSERLRRALGRAGLAPVAGASEASRGRAEQASIEPAELIEDAALSYHTVGERELWPGVVAFLDGTQRSEVVAYAGASPVIVAEVAAAVRERRDRVLHTACVRRRTIVVARPSSIAAAGDALAGTDLVLLPEEESPHPARDLNAAARAVDRARTAIEVAVGAEYRAVAPDTWLMVDGSLTQSPVWTADPRAAGIVKSHLALPFDGAELDRYLRLPFANRSSIFVPRFHRVAPVRSWAFRLWPWEGKDLFHGLVRLEVAPANGVPEVADRLCRWLLSERAPVSTPDPRWDRLLYGIHSVEQYLRASR